MGDGTTDDTAAIQAAVDAAVAAGGGTVFFPLGDYHDAAGSTDVNRIWCPGGAAVTLSPPAGGFAWCRLKYSGAEERWMLIGHS